jgi:hypothetical protein
MGRIGNHCCCPLGLGIGLEDTFGAALEGLRIVVAALVAA